MHKWPVFSSWLNNSAGFLFVFTLDCCSRLAAAVAAVSVVAAVVVAVVVAVVATAADKWKQRKKTHTNVL